MSARNQGWVYKARVSADAAGTSVLEFHVERFRHSDEAAWRAAIRLGRVRVNGEVVGPEHELRAGDELEFHRPPWDEPDAPESFEVAHEDEHVLVVVKPANLQVLPAGPFSTRTLFSLVRASDPSRAAAAPIHRLGRGTSGLIAFGKTLLGRSSLSRQMRELALGKTYLAWVEGERLPTSFEVRQPIAKIAHGPLKIHAAASNGRPSLTRVRVLRRDGNRSLVAAQPITGRPDQIRIHLAAAGAPIVGDPLFGVGGVPKSDVPPGAGGYLLHSAGLSYDDPVTGARIRLRSRPEWLAGERGIEGVDSP